MADNAAAMQKLNERTKLILINLYHVLELAISIAVIVVIIIGI